MLGRLSSLCVVVLRRLGGRDAGRRAVGLLVADCVPRRLLVACWWPIGGGGGRFLPACYIPPPIGHLVIWSNCRSRALFFSARPFFCVGRGHFWASLCLVVLFVLGRPFLLLLFIVACLGRSGAFFALLWVSGGIVGSVPLMGASGRYLIGLGRLVPGCVRGPLVVLADGALRLPDCRRDELVLVVFASFFGVFRAVFPFCLPI